MDDPFEFSNDWPAWRLGNFADFVRIQGIAAQLWGHGKIENLKRQLELPSPEIPAGAGLEELLALEKYAGLALADGHRWRPALGTVITVGSSQFTIAEAQYEIVRRALAALGN